MATTDDQLPYLLGRACTAAHLGDLAKLKEVVDEHPDVLSGSDYDLRTPLHVAASQGNLEVVQYLLEKGANANAEDRWGCTPLRDAHRSTDQAVITVLKSAGGVITDRSVLAVRLCKAAAVGDVGLITEILDQGASVDDKDYDGRTALHLAAARGQLEAVRFLIGKGADVNAKDKQAGSPLLDAINGQHNAVAELIKGAGGVLEDDASLLLCEYVLENNLDGIQRLIEGGADVNAADYDRRTALHVAACEGNMNIVKYLVEKGAGVDAEDRWGGTPLGDAIHHGHRDVADFLQANGAKNAAADISEERQQFTGSETLTESVADLEKLPVADIVAKGKATFGCPASGARVCEALSKKFVNDSDDSQKKAVAAASGVDLVVSWLSARPDESQLQLHGLTALRYLAGVDEHAPLIARSGGIRVALHGTRSQDPAIAAAACHVLSNASFPAAADIERVCSAIVRENGISLIIEALKKFQEQALMAEKGSAVLWNLMTVSSTNVHRVSKSGGLATLCNAWQLHQSNGNVVGSCAGAVSALLAQDELQKEFVEKRHGGSLCLSSLRKHQQHVGVCTAIAAVLALYIANNRNILSSLVLKNKGVRPLVDAMKAYPDELSLQENVASILASIVSALPKSARASQLGQLKKCGAERAISEAHKRFPDSEPLAKVNRTFRAAGCTIC